MRCSPVIALAVMAALGGCASSTSNAPRPTSTGSVRLTDNDSGRSVVVRLGDRITVVLGGNGQQWDQPSARGDAVRRTTAAGGYPTTLPARATFLAVSAGSAQLTATTDAACLHAQPRCMIPQRDWSVQVTIKG